MSRTEKYKIYKAGFTIDINSLKKLNYELIIEIKIIKLLQSM